MERGAEKQRREDREVVEEPGSVEKQWGDTEVLALISVWDEIGAQHGADSRATFELISERLRRLSVLRSWRECQAECRSLGLQNRMPDAAAGKSANYGPGLDGRLVEGWDKDVANQRGLYPPSVSMPTHEGTKSRIHPTLPYSPNVAEEGGRHWTDDEVRALLCIWADQNIRERLKSTLRNKCIFQEMAHQMQRKFGVVRNWKQCRTKYKNLKYDYKTAKSAHAARGGSSTGSPGKYMKFFEEVEAILLNKVMENGTAEMQKRLYNGDMAAERLQTPPRTTRQTAADTEIVIEIDDDDNSDEYDAEGEIESRWRGTEVHLTHADPSGPGQFHVVTVSDTGRNWSDQEVQALIQVWSDELICKQLESSTRKRDIFVQIANKLMQQGIERDWKQCHTKYKNLKYLYRSLQRGKADMTERKCIMRFYDEVDAIMTHPANGLPRDTTAADSAHSGTVTTLQSTEENQQDDVFLINTAPVADERTCSSYSVSSVATDVASDPDDPRIQTIKEHHVDQHYSEL